MVGDPKLASRRCQSVTQRATRSLRCVGRVLSSATTDGRQALELAVRDMSWDPCSSFFSPPQHRPWLPGLQATSAVHANSGQGVASAAATSSAIPFDMEPVIKYKGLRPEKDGHRWGASMILPCTGLTADLGYYETREEAARAYDGAARKYFVDPITNFLDDGSLNPDRLQQQRTRLKPKLGEELKRLEAQEAFRYKPKKEKAALACKMFDAALVEMNQGSGAERQAGGDGAGRTAGHGGGSEGTHRQARDEEAEGRGQQKRQEVPAADKEVEELVRLKRPRNDTFVVAEPSCETAVARIDRGSAVGLPGDDKVGRAAEHDFGGRSRSTILGVVRAEEVMPASATLQHQQLEPRDGQADGLAGMDIDEAREGMRPQQSRQAGQVTDRAVDRVPTQTATPQQQQRQPQQEGGLARGVVDEPGRPPQQQPREQQLQLKSEPRGVEDKKAARKEDQQQSGQQTPPPQEQQQQQVIDLTVHEQQHTARKEVPASSSAPTTAPTVTADTTMQGADSKATAQAAQQGRQSEAGGAVGIEVWRELKSAVFRKLMSVDGQALSEDEERKYQGLFQLLNKPTPLLRKMVEDVVVRSGFNSEAADRAARLLADMAAGGQLDD